MGEIETVVLLSRCWPRDRPYLGCRRQQICRDGRKSRKGMLTGWYFPMLVGSSERGRCNNEIKGGVLSVLSFLLDLLVLFVFKSENTKRMMFRSNAKIVPLCGIGTVSRPLQHANSLVHYTEQINIFQLLLLGSSHYCVPSSRTRSLSLPGLRKRKLVD